MSEQFPGIEGSDRPVAPPARVPGPPAIVEFDAVLIRPLDQQGDRNPPLIDPAGAQFDPDKRYPVFWNFEYDKLLGFARLSRQEDGSITAAGELHSTFRWAEDIQLRLAVNVRVPDGQPSEEVIRKSDIIAAALCREHSDPEQPPIVIHAQIRSET